MSALARSVRALSSYLTFLSHPAEFALAAHHLNPGEKRRGARISFAAPRWRLGIIETATIAANFKRNGKRGLIIISSGARAAV
jgi:hypothetical protein